MLALGLLGSILVDSHDKLLTDDQIQHDTSLQYIHHRMRLLVQQHMEYTKHSLTTMSLLLDSSYTTFALWY